MGLPPAEAGTVLAKRFHRQKEPLGEQHERTGNGHRGRAARGSSRRGRSWMQRRQLVLRGMLPGGHHCYQHRQGRAPQHQRRHQDLHLQAGPARRGREGRRCHREEMRRHPQGGDPLRPRGIRRGLRHRRTRRRHRNRSHARRHRRGSVPVRHDLRDRHQPLHDRGGQEERRQEGLGTPSRPSSGAPSPCPCRPTRRPGRRRPIR